MNSGFGESEAAKHAAAVINGDIPDVQLPSDLFHGDSEDDNDLDVFGESNRSVSASDPLGDGLNQPTSAADEFDVTMAKAVKKARIARPKLDANVLCGDQYGLAALHKVSKQLVQNDNISSQSGKELKSLRKIMNEYRKFAKNAFGSVDRPIFYEKCEKLGGGAQLRSLMQMLRDRTLREGDSDDENNYDDDDDNNNNNNNDEWGSSGVSYNNEQQKMNTSTTSKDVVSQMSDEEIKAKIAKNRAAAFERLAVRTKEKADALQKEQQWINTMAAGQTNQDQDGDGDVFMEDDDDDFFGSIDLVQIEKQAAEKKAALLKTKEMGGVVHMDPEDMMELSEDEDDDLEIEVVQKQKGSNNNNNSQSQDMSQLNYVESQDFQSQAKP